MDRCVGKNSIAFGDWYYPVDKTPRNNTYCQYCYDNCIHKAGFRKVLGQSSTITGWTCHCPLQSHHAVMGSITCPKCQLNPPTGSHNKLCTSCDVKLPSSGLMYCVGCSNQFKACSKCGETIVSGDTYIEQMSTILNKELEKMDRYVVMLKSELSAINQYKNMTPTDMVDILSTK